MAYASQSLGYSQRSSFCGSAYNRVANRHSGALRRQRLQISALLKQVMIQKI
jgi:hypothetical protein